MCIRARYQRRVRGPMIIKTLAFTILFAFVFSDESHCGAGNWPGPLASTTCYGGNGNSWKAYCGDMLHDVYPIDAAVSHLQSNECHWCFKLTATGCSPTGARAPRGSSVLVRIVDICYDNGEWCNSFPNHFGYYKHFDLFNCDRMHALGWDNPEVMYEQIACPGISDSDIVLNKTSNRH
eukprot:TRINITY_DN1933_c0_g1_i1.p1 TRINITY_DN1933_c0_g1~~TRINITY_DN1933_c0_g1_i1.p1  ORF type:complete len:179 (+),score=36.15 TRINITY_DN1933_c0_g1_i1:3-539(+)